MKAQWKQWQLMVNDWTLSRRILMLSSIIILSYVIWQNFVMDALIKESKQLTQTMAVLDAEILKINQTTQLFALKQKEDPNVVLRQSIKRLRNELSNIGGQLKVLTDRLISPREMADVIETMLLENKKMQLVELHGSGVESLLTGASAETTASKGLFRHGIRVIFNGSYLDTLDYLQALEALPIEFLWDRLQLNVNEYPQTQIILDIYTLSLSKDWVGV